MKTAIIANCKRNKTLIFPTLTRRGRKISVYLSITISPNTEDNYNGKTRAAAKQKNYKFVWINDNAEILIRHDENSKVRKIY